MTLKPRPTIIALRTVRLLALLPFLYVLGVMAYISLAFSPKDTTLGLGCIGLGLGFGIWVSVSLWRAIKPSAPLAWDTPQVMAACTAVMHSIVLLGMAWVGAGAISAMARP